MLARLLNGFLLLEGEPGGGGTASPDVTATAVAESQPADPDPASAPADGATSEEAAPEGDTAPAADGEAPALSAEDLQELIAAYPDQFQEALKAEAAKAPKEEPAPTGLTPRPNPVRESFALAGREASQRMNAVTQQYLAGTLTEIPEGFMADMETFGSWTNAEAEGRQLDLAERLLERTLGIDPAKLDESDPIQARYADALNARAQAHVNAFREFNKVYREPDPAKRAQILARAEQQQATATAAFLLERDALLVEHGKKLGSAAAEQEAGKRITATAEKAGKNGRTEAEARAQANLQARRATATAGSSGTPSPQHITYKELMKMTPAESAKLSPEEVDAITARALERS